MRTVSIWAAVLAAALLTACAVPVPIKNVDNAAVISAAGEAAERRPGQGGHHPRWRRPGLDRQGGRARQACRHAGAAHPYGGCRYRLFAHELQHHVQVEHRLEGERRQDPPELQRLDPEPHPGDQRPGSLRPEHSGRTCVARSSARRLARPVCARHAWWRREPFVRVADGVSSLRLDARSPVARDALRPHPARGRRHADRTRRPHRLARSFYRSVPLHAPADRLVVRLFHRRGGVDGCCEHRFRARERWRGGGVHALLCRRVLGSSAPFFPVRVFPRHGAAGARHCAGLASFEIGIAGTAGVMQQLFDSPLAAAPAHLDRPAVVDSRRSWTWREVHEASIELSRRLIDATAVCNLCTSRLGFLITFLAALRNRCLLVLPPSGGDADLAAVLRAGARPVVVGDADRRRRPDVRGTCPAPARGSATSPGPSGSLA